MDSLISAAARALAVGDPLGALRHVALRGDAPALALRGIAMAQLGELPRSRELLRRAARAFGPKELLARARCAVAEAEVALALRELGGSPRPLLAAGEALAARGDAANAAQARLIAARRSVLLGRLAEAAEVLAPLQSAPLPPAQAAVAALTQAELALRALQVRKARTALERAAQAAEAARVPALQAEVAELQSALARPAARWRSASQEKEATLDEIAALLDSGALVVDAGRHRVSTPGHGLDLARRPVLFVLVQALAAAWPHAAERNALIAQAFRQREPDETHRARLRVEIGRLRALLRPLAAIEATASGFVLRPLAGRDVVLLEPLLEGGPGALLALLADGAAWSTSALALALGASQRTVQRDLAALQEAGRVQPVGRARARRWVAAPLSGFTTILLLPASLPIA
jgi:DNA-binding transcriptional ArsR family regulator